MNAKQRRQVKRHGTPAQAMNVLLKEFYRWQKSNNDQAHWSQDSFNTWLQTIPLRDLENLQEAIDTRYPDLSLTLQIVTKELDRRIDLMILT